MATKDGRVRVLVYRVGESPEEERIPDSLEGSQAIVGGYIEAVDLASGLVAYVNEEGPRLNLPFNRVVAGRGGPLRIYGDFFITRSNGDQTADLTDRDIRASPAGPPPGTTGLLSFDL